jgi:hypothetical protein
MRPTFVQVCLCAVLFPSAASAQSAGWNGRVRVSVNGGLQVRSDTLSQSFTVQKNLESAPVTVDIDTSRGTLFDAGVVVRLKGRFGVGVAASFVNHESNADVTAEIPHPFHFNQPRTVTGTTPVSRTEVVAHLDVVYMVSRRKLELLLSGGPSFFNIDQTLATDVSYADTYPYDTATFTAATKTRVTKKATGFHVGTDVTWKLSRNVGLGGLLRFTRASATLSAASANTVSDQAGGLQAGGGVRVAF